MGHFRIVPSLFRKSFFPSNHIERVTFSSPGHNQAVYRVTQSARGLFANRNAFPEKRQFDLVVHPDYRIVPIAEGGKAPSHFTMGWFVKKIGRVAKVGLALFVAAVMGRMFENRLSGGSEGESPEGGSSGGREYDVGRTNPSSVPRGSFWEKSGWEFCRSYARRLAVERESLERRREIDPDRPSTICERWLRSCALASDPFGSEPFCVDSEELRGEFHSWKKPVPLQGESLREHLWWLKEKRKNPHLSSPVSPSPVPKEGAEEVPPELPLELLCVPADPLREAERQVRDYPGQVTFVLTFLPIGSGGKTYQRAAFSRVLAKMLSQLTSTKYQVTVPGWMVDLFERWDSCRLFLVRQMCGFFVDLADEMIAAQVIRTADTRMDQSVPECSDEDFRRVMKVIELIKKRLEHEERLRSVKSGKEPGVQAMIELGTYRSQGNGSRDEILQRSVNQLNRKGADIVWRILRGKMLDSASITFFRNSLFGSKTSDIIAADGLPRGITFSLVSVLYQLQPESSSVETVPIHVGNFQILCRIILFPFWAADRGWKAGTQSSGFSEGSEKFQERVRTKLAPYNPVRMEICSLSPPPEKADDGRGGGTFSSSTERESSLPTSEKADDGKGGASSTEGESSPPTPEDKQGG